MTGMNLLVKREREKRRLRKRRGNRPFAPQEAHFLTLFFLFAFHALSLPLPPKQNKLDEEAAAPKMAVPTLENGKEKGQETQAAAAAAPSHTPASAEAPHAHHHQKQQQHLRSDAEPHLHALARLRGAQARRRLQRAWRSFHGARSSELARALVATGVLGGGTGSDDDGASSPPPAAASPAPAAAVLGVGSSPPPLAHRASGDGILASDFDDLAAVLMMPATLKAARLFLARCEARVALRPHEAASAGVAASHGMLAASFARRRSGNGGGGSVGSSPAKPSSAAAAPAAAARHPLPGGRYPLRVFLSSLMMVAHPEVVFRSSNGEKEKVLRSAAAELRAALCVLLAAMIRGGGEASSSSSTTPLPRALAAALGEQTGITPPSRAISLFDAAWARFLAAFASWRAADAAALEADLVRAAVELEGSRLAVEAGAALAAAAAAEASSPSSLSSPEALPPRPRRAASGADAAEVSAGVERDLDLLRSKAKELGGEGAVRRLDAALEGVRARARAASEATLLMSSPAAERRGEREAQEAVADADAAAAPSPPGGANLLLPHSSGSPILNLPSISRAPSGTLPAPSKTESVLWGLIKSGGEPVGMLRLAEAIWSDAAEIHPLLPHPSPPSPTSRGPRQRPKHEPRRPLQPPRPRSRLLESTPPARQRPMLLLPLLAPPTRRGGAGPGSLSPRGPTATALLWSQRVRCRRRRGGSRAL